MANVKQLAILGTHGIPARHGGFETFAEHLALHLVKHGWNVTVYCPTQKGPIKETQWHGVKLVHIPSLLRGAFGTVIFDLRCIIHARRYRLPALTLGYNTAVFNILLSLSGIRTFMNMDGLEWKRAKWGPLASLWLWCNEGIALFAMDTLIADNPAIREHLRKRSKRPVAMIPYGATRTAPVPLPDFLHEQGLTAGEYLLIVARSEPENSLLQLVAAFSREPRGIKLVVLGDYNPESNPYHARIYAAASDEVLFIGAIYDSATVGSLRHHCLIYLHGHQVGGTNPSLVESLAAGNPVLAHDNEFNRWVAGDAARYFHDEDSAAFLISDLLRERHLLTEMSAAARSRYESNFRWPDILAQYETLLDPAAPARSDSCND